jgi:hypothetical protein
MYNLLDENKEKPQQQPVSSQPIQQGVVMNKSNVSTVPKKKGLSVKAKRVIGYSLITLSVLLLIGFFFIYLPAAKAYAQAKVVSAHLQVMSAHAKNQDIVGMQQELPLAQESLDKLKSDASGLVWTKFIPFFGNYYRDFEHGTNAGTAGLDAADKLIKIVSPYADLLGLKGKNSFTGSTQDRISRLVSTMDQIIPQLDSINPQLDTVTEEINQINPDRYSFSPKLKDTLTNAIAQANDAKTFLKDSKPFLEVLPQFLGKDKPEKYFIVFQNDKELRATGGFITAFAKLTVDKGNVVNSESSDIYTIDQQLRLKLTPPAGIQKYLPEPNGKIKTHWQIRDSNFYPDYKQSAILFENIYEYYKSKEYVSLTEDQLKQRQATDWDGLIAVDTHVVEQIISVLGSVEVDGVKFTSEMDKRCNCPNVVYELESYAEGQARGNAERKALIGDLMKEILVQSFKQESKIPALASEAIKLMNEKHVQVYMHDPKLQATVENLDWAGRVASADNPTKFKYEEGKWDYWHWNESNFAGKKANLYIKHVSDHKYEVAGDGTVTKTVTETISNTQKNDYWLNARYRSYFRVYVPGGSELITSDGSRDQIVTSRAYGKSVFEGFVEVDPLQTKKITLKYRLPFKINKGDTYKALFQKQAGTGAFEYSIKGLGEDLKFDLNQDRKVEVQM